MSVRNVRNVTFRTPDSVTSAYGVSIDTVHPDADPDHINRLVADRRPTDSNHHHREPVLMRAKQFDESLIWPVILSDIASGASLTSALRRLTPSPSYWWAKDSLRRDAVLRARYQEACEDRADRLAEELLELADQPIPEELDGPGRSAWVQKLRLQVDARKWIACKLKPRQYGERLDLEVKHTSISIIAALAEAERRIEGARSVKHLRFDTTLNAGSAP